MSETCALIESWFRQARSTGSDDLPPDSLVAHVTNCARCRARLIILLADLCGPWSVPANLSCDLVEEHIPTFVDYELARGFVAAVKTFPDIWWHTLVCPNCDTVYRSLCELAELPYEPVIRVVEPPPIHLAIKTQIQVSLRTLRQFLDADSRLGVAWGNQDHDVVIATGYDDFGLIQVSVRHKKPSGIALVVSVDPPAVGSVALSVAELHYREVLNRQGCVVFAQLPEECFNAYADTTFAFTIYE